MVMPAEGPSFGMAPAGTCTCTSQVSKYFGVEVEFRCVCLEVLQCNHRALLHHVSQVSSEGQFALSAHHARLNEKDVPASRRPRQPCDHTCDLVAFVALFFVRGSQNVYQFFRRNLKCLCFTLHGHLHGSVADHFGDALVQSTHATFVGVLGTDFLQGLVRDLNLFFRDARFVDMLLDEVSLGDLDLFFHGVSCDLNDLHAVPQCGLNGGQGVGCGQEHDLRKVVVKLEVIVVKRAVLLRVQTSSMAEEGSPCEVPAELVNLVENKQRVGSARLLEVLNDPTGHRADVGLAVPSDFRFVPQSAQATCAHTPCPGFCDGFAQRSLSYPRRSVQANDGRFHVPFQLQDSQVLNDALFDLSPIRSGRHPMSPGHGPGRSCLPR